MSTISTSKKDLMLFQKKMLGLSGFFLVPFAILFGLIGGDSNPSGWWHSISMTYYANSNICMIGVLFSMSVLFFSYLGYGTSDRIMTFIAGMSALGILVFPCGYEGLEITGLFGLQSHISKSIHYVFASMLFLSFAVMVGYNFTRTSSDDIMTPEKKKRNTIYYTCSAIIVVFLLFKVVVSAFSLPEFLTLINEWIMLLAFSFAWLVKAEFFEFLNDKSVAENIA